MPEVHFILPGDPETLTGGYLYDKRIIAGLREIGWRVQVIALPDGFPSPDDAAVEAARTAFAALPDGALVVADGLALGVLPEIAIAHAKRLRLIGLVHHPLAREGGLSADRRAELYESERRALSAVRRVIVTSQATATALAAYNVGPARLHVVRPGCDPHPLAVGLGGSQFGLLCVATLTARKGHVRLLEALAGLKDRPWHLTCVGGADHEPGTAARIKATIRELDLENRVSLVGAVPPAALTAHYNAADLFVLASEHEGYGMALAEALAHGLPIVSTRAGAIPETVPEAAALLVPTLDPDALGDALRQVLDEEDLRVRLAAGARTARSRLPSWPQAVEQFASALDLSESTFSANWLALREAPDQSARDPGLLSKLRAWRRTKGVVTVVDLGSGTGSNLRFLASYLAGEQSWRLIEKDGTLMLGAVRPADPESKLTVETRIADLADSDLDTLSSGADLITASALMDLAAPTWFDRLAEAAARRRAALYVTLTYDGRIELTPNHPDDHRIVTAFNDHQRRDKGLGGPALGPTASDHMAKTLEALDYRVETAASDWSLAPAQAALIEHLVVGWADAAGEIAPELAETIAAWRADRLTNLRRGQLSARVGHLDLLAFPPA